MGPLDVLVVAGAVAWLSHALVRKDGPHELLQHLRVFFGVHLGKNSPLGCVFCTSFWVGLAVVLLYSTGNTVITSIIQYFGVLGVAAVFFGGYE